MLNTFIFGGVLVIAGIVLLPFRVVYFNEKWNQYKTLPFYKKITVIFLEIVDVFSSIRLIE